MWAPTEEDVRSAAVSRLMGAANDRHNLALKSYDDLHRWSTTRPGQFWALVWDVCFPAVPRADVALTSGPFETVQFFPTSELNAAEVLLDSSFASRTAVIEVREDGSRREVDRSTLANDVELAAQALNRAYVEPGDRVVAWAPNRYEVVVFALAALKLGALVSTASPDFAPNAVVDRFGQLEPKVLLGVGTYQYKGTVRNVENQLSQIAKGLTSVETVICLDDNVSGWLTWTEWSTGLNGVRAPFPKYNFAHPGFVLFSSGTTGKPKCIVHSAAGVLLKLQAEQVFNVGIGRDDLVFFYTTTGWMMWNWLVYALGTGAAILLYDGHPMYPSPDRLFEIAADNQVSTLGVSAKYLEELNSQGFAPRSTHPNTYMKVLLSTGSPLSPDTYDYVYRSCVDGSTQLISMSGGTDICGSFVGGVPTLPVYRGEIQRPILGMAVDVFSEDGTSAAVGETGELVCTRPFPSVPLGFWGDVDGSKFHESYFARFPGVWTHGDFTTKTLHGGYEILGRSDATLNVNGVRIGTAEIYNVLDAIPAVKEALAVEQRAAQATRIVLFVCVNAGFSLDASLEQSIREMLRTGASPRHVPDLIVAVPEIPRTKSNKTVETTVADILNGRSVRNRDALDNPQSLDWFYTFAASSQGSLKTSESTPNWPRDN